MGEVEHMCGTIGGHQSVQLNNDVGLQLLGFSSVMGDVGLEFWVAARRSDTLGIRSWALALRSERLDFSSWPYVGLASRPRSRTTEIEHQGLRCVLNSGCRAQGRTLAPICSIWCVYILIYT